MRKSSFLLAGLVVALFQSSAKAQVFLNTGYGYGSPGLGYGGYYGGYGYGGYGGFLARPAGPIGFTYYSPFDGYAHALQTGLPWRAGSGPIQRSTTGIRAPGGVVRYSREPNIPNDSYIVRDGVKVPPPAEADKGATGVASAQETNAPLRPKPLAKNATRTTHHPYYYRSPSEIAANGGADWVPNVPSR